MQHYSQRNNKFSFFFSLLFFLFFFSFSMGQNVEFEKENFKDRKDAFKEAREFYQIGDENFSKGEQFFAVALDFFIKAQNFNPNNALLNFKIGRCYIISNNKSKALPFFEKAFILNPTVDSDIHYYLGLSYHLDMQWEKQ